MFRVLGFSLLCAALAPAGVAVQDCTPNEWIGNEGDWSDGSSWLSGVEPTVEDCATIAGDGFVLVTLAGETCAELVLGATDATGGTLQI